MGYRMKIILIIFFLFSTTVIAQVFDTAYIAPRNALTSKGNKVATISLPRNSNDSIAVQYFNGTRWNNISMNNEPTLKDRVSKCVFAYYSDYLFVTGLYHLWEFDGYKWSKHAIYDSLYKIRIFEDVIALPDSSLLITAYSRLLDGKVWNGFPVDSILHELLQFKNGVFTTIKSRWTYPKKGGEFGNAFNWLKYHKNNTYSMLTNIESEDFKTRELVLYNINGQIIRKDTFPDLKPFGFVDTAIQYNDYLYDSNENLWLLTYSPPIFYKDSSNKLVTTANFIGLVKISSNGIVSFYNDNIGVEKSYYDSQSFTIDENDNIWFFYNYRINPQFPTNPTYPSLYRLDSTRENITEYRYETYLKYSEIYSGGINMNFGGTTYGLILFNNFTNSLFVTRNGTNMLQFFLNRIPTTTEERNIVPNQVFPNPIQNGNTITIESNVFEKGNYPLSIRIQDISGALIHEGTISANGNKLQFTTQDLVTGTYFVSILSNNKTILQTKFIKE